MRNKNKNYLVFTMILLSSAYNTATQERVNVDTLFLEMLNRAVNRIRNPEDLRQEDAQKSTEVRAMEDEICRSLPGSVVWRTVIRPLVDSADKLAEFRNVTLQNPRKVALLKQEVVAALNERYPLGRESMTSQEGDAFLILKAQYPALSSDSIVFSLSDARLSGLNPEQHIENMRRVRERFPTLEDWELAHLLREVTLSRLTLDQYIQNMQLVQAQFPAISDSEVVYILKSARVSETSLTQYIDNLKNLIAHQRSILEQINNKLSNIENVVTAQFRFGHGTPSESEKTRLVQTIRERLGKIMESLTENLISKPAVWVWLLPNNSAKKDYMVSLYSNIAHGRDQTQSAFFQMIKNENPSYDYKWRLTTPAGKFSLRVEVPEVHKDDSQFIQCEIYYDTPTDSSNPEVTGSIDITLRDVRLPAIPVATLDQFLDKKAPINFEAR